MDTENVVNAGKRRLSIDESKVREVEVSEVHASGDEEERNAPNPNSDKEKTAPNPNSADKTAPNPNNLAAPNPNNLTAPNPNTT